jgi:protein-S-isoprenylcysteine O-methyltransferase Ste14
MHVVEFIIGAGWVAFWIYWLIASFDAKEGQTRWGRFGSIRIAVIVIVLLLLRTRVFGHSQPTNNPWLQGLGLVLFVSGLALAVWARVYLGRNWGMPMTQKVDPELVMTGPYSRVRHPIYSGIILAMIGTTIAVTVYWLVAVVVVGAYFVFSAMAEERFMATRFPDSYPEYKRATRMLVPFFF